MLKVAEILRIACAEIGTVESPPDSNRQKYGLAYGWNGVAWCAIFVWWCFHQAGADALLPIKTASCALFMSEAKKAGQWVTSGYQPGDVLIYNFGTAKNPQRHTGILESISGSVFTAIEGNTAIGNDDNGGRVMRRVRKKSVVEGAFRPKYSTLPLALVAQKVIDGEFGNGIQRYGRLAAAGYKYSEVQPIVNALLKGTYQVKVVVTSGTLNVRKNHSTEKSAIVDKLENGAIVTVLEVRDGTGAAAWGRISNSGKGSRGWSTGWISLDFTMEV